MEAKVNSLLAPLPSSRQSSSSSASKSSERKAEFKATRFTDSVLHVACSFLSVSDHVTAFARCCRHWQHAAAHAASWNGVMFAPPRTIQCALLQGIVDRWKLYRCRGYRGRGDCMLPADFAALKCMSNTLEVLELNINPGEMLDTFPWHPLPAVSMNSDSTLCMSLKYTLDALPNLKRLALPPMRFVTGLVDSYGDPTATAYRKSLPSWLACMPPALESLSLDSCRGNILDGALPQFCPRLTELDLKGSLLITLLPMETKGLLHESIMSQFERMPKLTRLKAASCRQEFSTPLKNVNSFCHITDLDLDDNNLHYTGMKHEYRFWVAQLPKQLRRLSLRRNNIHGLQFITSLPCLEDLDVSDNKLSPGSLVVLIWESKSLRKLNVTRCGVQFWEAVEFHLLRQREVADLMIPSPPVALINEVDMSELVNDVLGGTTDDKAIYFTNDDVKTEVNRRWEAQTSSESSDDSEFDDWEDAELEEAEEDDDDEGEEDNFWKTDSEPDFDEGYKPKKKRSKKAKAPEAKKKKKKKLEGKRKRTQSSSAKSGIGKRKSVVKKRRMRGP